MEKHFENIPENWQIVNLEKLGKCINGLTYSPDDIRETGSLVLRSSNVQNDFITYEDNVYVREDLRFNPTQKGDVLICVRNGSRNLIGKTARITERSANNAFGAFMTIYRSTENDFLNYFFKSSFFFREVHRNLGATINSINNTDLLKFKVPLPSEKERVAIANCLSTWDVAIEKQTKLIAAKEQRKKALMQQLLSGKKRLPGFTKDWKEVSLGKLFSERVETKREDLELLSVGQQGVYPQTESNKRDISNADKSKYKRIVPGDIGYNTMRMWQGRSALSGIEGIVSPAYTILIPRDKVDSYFFSCLFKTKKLMHLFWRNSQGLVGDTLNCKYKDFSIIKISIPSFEEQQKISTMLKNQDNEIILMKKKLDFLLGQKKGIMQKLLTGKVRLIP